MWPKEHPSRTLPKKGSWEELHLFPARNIPVKQKTKLIPYTPTERRLGRAPFVSCTQCTRETKSETQYAHAANKKEGQAPPKFPIHLNSEFFILNSEFPLPLYFAFSTFITGFAMNTASTMQMMVSGIR